MCGNIYLLFCASFILFEVGKAGLLVKNKITFEKVEFITSDPGIMDMQLSVRDKSDTEQEASGWVYFEKTMDQDAYDNFKVFSSPDSMNCDEMKLIPFLTLPQKDTKSFMNDVYKPFVMPDVKGCSDLPVFEGDWGDRSLAGNYTVNKCIAKTDQMQAIFSKGNYCLKVLIENKVVEPKFNAEMRVLVTVT